MNATYLRVSLALFAVGGLGAFAACGGGDDDGGDTKPAATKAAVDVKDGSSGNSSAKVDSDDKATEVVFHLTENAFNPSTLTVEAGKPITFVAKNDGAAVHNMKLLTQKTEGKDYSSDATIAPGKESKFTVTFTKKGTVKFQCDYHLPDMVGTITVK